MTATNRDDVAPTGSLGELHGRLVRFLGMTDPTAQGDLWNNLIYLGSLTDLCANDKARAREKITGMDYTVVEDYFYLLLCINAMSLHNLEVTESRLYEKKISGRQPDGWSD